MLTLLNDHKWSRHVKLKYRIEITIGKLHYAKWNVEYGIFVKMIDSNDLHIILHQIVLTLGICITNSEKKND